MLCLDRDLLGGLLSWSQQVHRSEETLLTLEGQGVS